MVTIGGQPVKLVAVGYLAHATKRTCWTVRYWQRLGLLPPPPFALRRDDPQRRRWLYPTEFVDAVAQIVKEMEIGPRLERSMWPSFQSAVSRAYETTVLPLLEDGDA